MGYNNSTVGRLRINHKRRWLGIGLAAVAVALTVVAVVVHPKMPAAGVSPKAAISPSVGAASNPTPPPDPMTIAAMEARSYTASRITTDRRLGDLGGYSASVVGFTSDGLHEQAYLALPDGTEPAGGWPVIVLVHGYIVPNTYNTVGNAYGTWIGAWARAGFMVVQPDLRGNGSSAGQPVSGHWSPEYTYDVMNLIASLRADNQVNPTRIGVAGHSMGGHIALNVAVISHDIAATLLANGVVGTMDQLIDNWPNSPTPNDQPVAVTRGELAALEQAHRTPTADPTWWDSASAITYVANVAGPVQIDGDEGDVVVPYAWQQQLAAALTAAGKPVTLYSYSGNDHQLSNPTNLALFLERSTAFWRQSLH